MSGYYLNLSTKLNDLNREDGLVICGINWGGGDDSGYTWTHDVVGESFFSDIRFNGFPYTNRIVRWFDRFGHPLATKPCDAGSFEHSIVQTNWQRNQSRNVRGRNVHADCMGALGNFEFHMSRLKPRLLMFMGVQLLDVLNSPECMMTARRLFGTPQPIAWERRDVYAAGRRLRRLRLGIQAWDRVQIIAFPHPTGSVGLSDDYIAAFSDVVSPLLAKFKRERGLCS